MLNSDPTILPLATDFSEADIKAHTNYELILSFPEWTDDGAWEEYQRELGRISLAIQPFRPRCYVYPEQSQKMLGIFVHHDDLPPGGAAKLAF